jgi:branched-chain amino acid transport system permease protein
MINKQVSIRGRGKLTGPAVWAGVLVVVSAFPLFIKSPYLLHVFILTFIYIIAAASLRLISTSGQYPLAHAAFMGIGAYTAAVISKELGWTPWLTILLGGLMAMGIGVLIGYPFARLRAFYYAMVSLFFGIGMIDVINVFGEWTGGPTGLTGIPPLLPGVTSKVPYFYLSLGLTALCLLALYRFEHCRIGIDLKAIAQSHLVASSVGINEAMYRVLTLAVGCFFAGIAGTVYAHYNLTLTADSFNMVATLWLFMYVLIGGIGSFSGPIVGTALLVITPEIFRGAKEFVPFISAGILLIVIFVIPQGIVGLPMLVRSWFIKRSKRKVATNVS